MSRPQRPLLAPVLGPRLVLVLGLGLACGSSAEPSTGSNSSSATAGEDAGLAALCEHFVAISSEAESDQLAKRDRKQDYAECMTNFPAMESQLKGEEKTNFRNCALKTKDLKGFTSCAPSLFAPPKAKVGAPKAP